MDFHFCVFFEGKTSNLIGLYVFLKKGGSNLVDLVLQGSILQCLSPASCHAPREIS